MRSKFTAAIAGILLILGAFAVPAQAGGGLVDGPGQHRIPNVLLKSSNKANSVHPLLTGPYYYWATGQAYPSTGTDGMVVGADVANPQFNTVHDYHDIFEITLADASTNQRIELGWTKSATECPNTTAPCLFVFRWDNAVGAGYNTAGGFIKCNGTNGCAVPTVGVGQSLTTSTTPKSFLLQRGVGSWPTSQWWASYDGQWLGYWNDSSWTGGGPAFGRAYQVAAFGEIASKQAYPTASPCSAMGNGQPGTGTTPTPARQGNLAYVNTTDVPSWNSLSHTTSISGVTDPYYSIAALGTAGTGFKYGGDNSLC